MFIINTIIPNNSNHEIKAHCRAKDGSIGSYFWDVFHKFLITHENLRFEIKSLWVSWPIEKINGSKHEFGAIKVLKE